MGKFISVVTASKYPQKVEGLLDSLEQTAEDHSSFEFLIKVDDDDRSMIEFISTEARKRPFEIRTLISPKLTGYHSIYLAIDELIKLAAKETHFIWVPNDETRLATRNWDSIVRKHIGLFDDDIYYLRISKNKNKIFRLVDTLHKAEHFGIFTKKWWTLAGGVGRGGQDTGPEMLNYYLRTVCKLERSIPIDGIDIADEVNTVSSGHGLSEEQYREKERGVFLMYSKLLAPETQTNVLRNAQRMAAHCWAIEQGFVDFELVDHFDSNSFKVISDPKQKTENSFPYMLHLPDWFRLICNSIAYQTWYLAWPPVLANLVEARRRLCCIWLQNGWAEYDDAYLDELAQMHATLRQMFSQSIGHNWEKLRLSTYNKGVVNLCIEYITAGYYGLSQSQMNENIGNLIRDENHDNYLGALLAADLMGYDLPEDSRRLICSRLPAINQLVDLQDAAVAAHYTR